MLLNEQVELPNQADPSNLPYAVVIGQNDANQHELCHNVDNASNKKNNWRCLHIKLPITGKLSKMNSIMVILSIDLVATLCLFCTTHKWWFLTGHPYDFINLYDDFTNFHRGTSDTIFLLILRFLSLWILSCIAIKKGVPKELWTENRNCCCVSLICCNSKSNRTNTRRHKNTSEIQNLLSTDNEAVAGIDDNRSLLPQFDTKSENESYEQRKQKCVAYKYCILLLMFLLCTAFQAYIGIKCVTFDFLSNDSYKVAQAVLYGVSVCCINIEIFLFKEFVESATNLGDSIMVKTLHPHPLKQKKKVKFWCNLCRSRAKYFTYRCDDCAFDVCSSCYKKERKKLKAKQEEKLKKEKQSSMKDGGKLSNNININAASESFKYGNSSMAPQNDPTEQLQKEITGTRYMMRALSLCRPHAYLICTAFTCLAINSAANLLLPRSQGKILDTIAGDPNRKEFVYQIKLYLILSVVVGLFGSIRNLCFRFTIRRLMVSIRSMMFSNLIVQDIQFFDDMSTGELISRMTNDVGSMLSPLRTMLQSTLSNIILLFGGLIMCFITSWRLSMLAFTTVAPVLFLTGQYAKWSKTINRAICMLSTFSHTCLNFRSQTSTPFPYFFKKLSSVLCFPAI